MIKDFGGAGTPVVLLHGLGGSSADWTAFAGELTSYHHVIGLDLPTEGQWSWDKPLDDIEALGLDNPAVVGMSLGGMLAARWGLRHPECPGVVSFDGHRPPLTALENYEGMPRTEVESAITRLKAVFDEQAKAATHLSPELLDSVSDAMRRDDTVAVFGEVRCPTLLVLATKTLPRAMEFDDLMIAYRAGLERDLAAVTAANPHFSVVRVDANHGMVFEQPVELAKMIVKRLEPSSGG